MFLDFQEFRDIVGYYFVLFLTYVLISHVPDYRYPVWGLALVMLLPTILPNDSMLRYISCFACYLVVAFLSSAVAGFVFMFKPFDTQSISYFAHGELLLSRIFGITYDLRNLERLDLSKKSIILFNHQSFIDTFVICHLWKRLGNARPVAKRELFYYWPMGITAWLTGTIFVEKMSGPKARKHFMDEAKNHLTKDENQACIVIYPEGKRNSDKTCLLPFRKGAFYLAAELSIPIIPVVISPYRFLSDNYFKSGTITVTVLEPINEDNFSVENVNDMVKSTRDLMNCVYSSQVEA